MDKLEQGRKRFEDAIGLWGNMCDIKLPNNCADIIVSTNTMHWLNQEGKKQAINTFVRLLKNSGILCIQVSCKLKEREYIIEILSKNFHEIKIKYYGNIISRIFEYCFVVNPVYSLKHIVGRNKAFIQIAYYLFKIRKVHRHFKI